MLKTGNENEVEDEREREREKKTAEKKSVLIYRYGCAH